MGTTLTRLETFRLFSLGHLELVYEGRREPYANLHELQKAIRQKWNEINDLPIKNAILQWKRRLAAVTKQDGDQLSTSSGERLLKLLITD